HVEVVGASTAAIHRDRPRLVAAVEKIGSAGGSDAGLDLQKLIGVASTERQTGDGLGVDRGTKLRAGGIYQRRLAGDVYDLVRAAELHGDFKVQDLVQFQAHALAHIFLKAAVVDCNRVHADRKLQYGEISVAAGLRVVGDAGGFVGQGDLGARNDRAGSISHAADDASTGGLGLQ